MPRRHGERSGGKPRESQRSRPPANRRTIKRDEKTSQLLERGEGATAEEQLDSSVDSPSEIADAPGYGDWAPHATGRTSGARGRERFDFPGEETWGEAQRAGEAGEERRASPRNSDAVLAHTLREILAADPELDSGSIEVEVDRGDVTLSGTVESTDAKLLAEELVDSVQGVREVHNRLRAGD